MTLLKFYLENDNFMGTYHIESNVLGTIEGSKRKWQGYFKRGFYHPFGKKTHKYKEQVSLHSLCLSGDWTYPTELLWGTSLSLTGEEAAGWLGGRPPSSHTGLSLRRPRAWFAALLLPCRILNF